MRVISKGFSLIELMIVIVIIGILAAVAVPSYYSYMVQSRVGAVIPLMNSIKDVFIENYEATGSWGGYPNPPVNQLEYVYGSVGSDNQLQLLFMFNNVDSAVNGQLLYLILTPDNYGGVSVCCGPKADTRYASPSSEYLPSSCSVPCNFVE